MSPEDLNRFWRKQGTADGPAVPVPDHLIDEDWRLGHE